MIAFLWDESANEDVLRAWRHDMPNCDVLTVHEAQLSGVSDDEIADWARAHDRVIVTQDRTTMPGVVVRRIRSGQFVPGIVVMDLTQLSPGAAAEELALIAEASLPGELANRVVFLPLR
ncbi:MAG: DUF5615 family PIN-like protein [Acidobacteria bacterium]|nr:DUF5615 family PIN-like protein [Acidobacteriota bacterium]